MDIKNAKALLGGAIHKHYLYGDVVKRIACDSSIVESLPIDKQYNVLKSLKGVKSPTVLSLSSQSFDMKYIHGHILAKPNTKHIIDMGVELANIHKHTIPDGVECIATHARIDMFLEVLNKANMLYPTLAHTADWLKDNIPTPESYLIHGDFRLGNILLGKDCVNGVLDWEFAHIGNRAEDLGWMLSTVWDSHDYEDAILKSYNKQSAVPIDKKELEYWKIFTCLRFASIASQQYERSKINHDIELFATGWRVLGCVKILQKYNCIMESAISKKELSSNTFTDSNIFPSKKVYFSCVFPSLFACIKGHITLKEYLNSLYIGIKYIYNRSK